MRAVRYYGKEDVRIDEVPAPQCSPTGVLVAPAFNGICGTDLYEYINGPHNHPAEPHPLTGEKTPIILGHEFSGIVIKAGNKVKNLQVGDKVAVKGTLWCGECEPCILGKQHACVKAGNLGQSGMGGGLAELCPAEEAWCYKLPENVSLEIGALIEPLAVAEHGISHVEPPLQLHEYALVSGAGAIGLAVVQLLRARGMKKIIISEISAARRRAALEFGASIAVDPAISADINAEIVGLTEGKGPHVVFECSGAHSALRTAVRVVRHFGTIVAIAEYAGNVTFNINALLFREITYKGSLSHTPENWRTVVQWLKEGRLEPSKMITKVVPADKVVEDGIIALQRADEGLVKILVEVSSANKLEEMVGRRAYEAA